MNIRKYFVGLFFCVSLMNYSMTSANESLPMKNDLPHSLEALSQSRLFFGHMSVGGNIVDGIEDLKAENPDIPLEIIERGKSSQLPEHFLLHSSIGKNTEPLTKCLDFKNIIETELKDQVDFAMFKFCYIDILENTDVDQLFSEYSKIMDELIIKFPSIRFIHVTAALRHVNSGPSVWIRELIGRPNNSKIANIKRNQFNQLMREYYKDQPIFDLANSMSTYPDGKNETFSYKGESGYRRLIEEYTYDGRHLNEYGRKKVAKDFINQLADIIRNKNI